MCEKTGGMIMEKTLIVFASLLILTIFCLIVGLCHHDDVLNELKDRIRKLEDKWGE
jgi:hypothetical protein